MQVLNFGADRPLKLVSAGHFTSSGEWIHPKRTIDTYVLLIGERGTAYIYEGENEYSLTQGSSLILSPYTEHGGFKPSDNVSYYWFHFNINDDSYENKNELKIPKYFSGFHTERLFILSHQLLHVYESKYTNICAEDYLFTLILIELSEQFAVNTHTKPNDDDRNFYRIREWIRINSASKLSLDDVAEKFNYNKNYLCRIFKRHTGMTVQEYINKIKISKAKQYLYSTNKSVREIAFLVGYEDEKYMMRVFKQYEKMTPSQFRNAYTKTHMNNA